jgi:hypothetical protein
MSAGNEGAHEENNREMKANERWFDQSTNALNEDISAESKSSDEWMK